MTGKKTTFPFSFLFFSLGAKHDYETWVRRLNFHSHKKMSEYEYEYLEDVEVTLYLWCKHQSIPAINGQGEKEGRCDEPFSLFPFPVPVPGNNDIKFQRTSIITMLWTSPYFLSPLTSTSLSSHTLFVISYSLPTFDQSISYWDGFREMLQKHPTRQGRPKRTPPCNTKEDYSFPPFSTSVSHIFTHVNPFHQTEVLCFSFSFSFSSSFLFLFEKIQITFSSSYSHHSISLYSQLA